jgi:hypothetical protein
LVFDTTHLDDVHTEMSGRFLAGEGAPYREVLAVVEQYQKAFDAHDYDALRDALDDGFVLCDHRPMGLGEIAGADAYVASVRALHQLAPIGTAQVVATLAFDQHGLLALSRVRGALADGGQFEKDFLGLFHVQGGRLRGYEFFDLTEEPAARSRFAALRDQSS